LGKEKGLKYFKNIVGFDQKGRNVGFGFKVDARFVHDIVLDHGFFTYKDRIYVKERLKKFFIFYQETELLMYKLLI